MGLVVLREGLQSTVQDQGRFGYAHLGVSASGAADNFSLRIGNILVGVISIADSKVVGICVKLIAIKKVTHRG